jgi:hypothetical protein
MKTLCVNNDKPGRSPFVIYTLTNWNKIYYWKQKKLIIEDFRSIEDYTLTNWNKIYDWKQKKTNYRGFSKKNWLHKFTVASRIKSLVGKLLNTVLFE